jgi:hypothetical protein
MGLDKLPPKLKIWLPIALFVIAVAAAVVFFYLKQPGSEGPLAYGEDKLPAVKVVVTNGCGYEQLASEFAETLKNKNIEVVSLGDTPKPIYDKSVIVVRKGDMQDLKRLQKMTGIQRWTSAINEYYNADFEIIVGRDYEQYTN